MYEQATSETILNLFGKGIVETRRRIKNLEKVFELLGEKPERIERQRYPDPITEGDILLKEATENPTLADFLLAGSDTRVEVYGFACYEGLIIAAEMMGKQEIVKLLKENFKPE